MLGHSSTVPFLVLVLQTFSYSWARVGVIPDQICLEPPCNHDVLLEIASELLEKMDINVKPCDNFYKFACGGFSKSTNIPTGKNIVDSFSMVMDKVQDQIKRSIEEPSQPNEPIRFSLAKKLYRACISAGENGSKNALLKVLKKLGGWPVIEGYKWNTSAFNWISLTYNFNDMGLNTNHILSLEVKKDFENITNRVIYLDQPYSLIERIREISHLLNMKNDIKKSYINYMVDIAVLLGANRKRAMRDMTNSYNFEIELAQLFLSIEKRQNFALRQNSMTVSELSKNYPSIPWKDYFNRLLSLNVDDSEVVIIMAPGFLKDLQKLLRKTRKRILSDYMIWRIVHDSVQYLNDEIRQTSVDFFELLTGESPEILSRSEKCQTIVEAKLLKSVDALYIRKYFNEEIEKNVGEIVSNIRIELIKVLRNLPWMDEATRKSAIKKMESMSSEIGCSKNLLNASKIEESYKDLEILEDNYLQSMLNLELFERKKSSGRFEETMDETQNSPTFLSPTSVSAFYSRPDNGIHISAGILQGAFFGIERPEYINYARIGFIIGHEMTHGFDNQRRNYDSVGKLSNWWTPDADRMYLQKVKCIIEQYGNYTVEDVGLRLDGTRTQTENIADNGGIKLAYWAYRHWSEKNEPEPNLPGFTYNHRQIFWISFANLWCRKYRLKTLKNRVEKDTYCPAEFRIIGSLSNMPEFAQDFNCPLGSQMNPHKKCNFW